MHQAVMEAKILDALRKTKREGSTRSLNHVSHRIGFVRNDGETAQAIARLATRLLFGESAFRVIALDSQEVKLLADGGFIQNLRLESLRNEIETGGAKIIDAESLECGGVAKVLSSTKAELDEAVRRLRLTEAARDLISARSERRWRKRQREAILTFGPMGEFCGLIPDIGNRGNYGCKLSQSFKRETRVNSQTAARIRS